MCFDVNIFFKNNNSYKIVSNNVISDLIKSYQKNKIFIHNLMPTT